MEWSNEVVLEFLRLYEAEPAIWNPNHADHKRRKSVHVGWARIQEGLASQKIKCTVKDLKKKKESLMATFRPTWRKYKASKKSGNSYKPNWFAFEAMSRFLTGIYTPKPTANSEDHREETTIPLSSVMEVDKNNSESVTAEQIKPQPSTKEDPLKETYASTRNACDVEGKDECSLFTALLAKRLRDFDEATRQILMHNIDNLVFEARIKQLPTASVCSNNAQVISSTAPSTSAQPQFQSNTYIIQQSPTWSEKSLSSSADETSSVTIVPQPKSSPTWSESSSELFKEESL